MIVRHIGRLLPMTAPVIEDAAVVIRDERVAWLGRDADLPAGADGEELDASGACAVPGFVDPHTHLVWAGTRRDDFVGRLAGQPYTPLGIHATVAATRAATDLPDLVAGRIATMRANGATTVEVKSGYGLSPEAELRLLDVATAVTDEVTYLGAHAVPPDTDRAA